MKTNQPTQLTFAEEIDLLGQITPNLYLDQGSSRVVFNHPTNPHLVVKVAFGDGGIVQNLKEVEVYENNPHLQPCLAPIIAYGDFTIVMSKVEVVDLEEECDTETEIDCWEPFTYPEKFLVIKDALEEVLGESGDNYQIGIDINGNYCAYDYGFSTLNVAETSSSIGKIYLLGDKLVRQLPEIVISILENGVDNTLYQYELDIDRYYSEIWANYGKLRQMYHKPEVESRPKANLSIIDRHELT